MFTLERPALCFLDVYTHVAGAAGAIFDVAIARAAMADSAHVAIITATINDAIWSPTRSTCTLAWPARLRSRHAHT